MPGTSLGTLFVKHFKVFAATSEVSFVIPDSDPLRSYLVLKQYL